MRIHSSARFLFFVILILGMSAASFGQIGVGISVNFGPPAIPVYVQPPCPSEGYIWTPGYWAWDADINDYYWVPGTWVLAPQVGYLWTPGWWGWGGNAFLFHTGYWGPRIGFYGGINYGFGYFGNGYEGGRWDHDHFFYNRSVTNVNVTNVTNVYNTTVINNNNTRTSYNGGQGGIEARPTSEQTAAEHERHLPPVAAQTEHVQAARSNPELRATVNHGKPPVAATPRPGALKEGVPAKEAGAPYNPGNRGETNRGEANVPKPPNATHAKDLSPHEKPPAPNTGNPKQDAKYQQQQDKLYAKQQQEHEKAAQQQEQQHQKMAQQQAKQQQQQQNEQKQRQMEQKQQQMEVKHQQQTQQMEQKHVQQQQQMQQHQQPQPHQQPPSHGEPQHH